MKASRDFMEQRQHERASVQKIVIGILNSDEPLTIGLVHDISLGGVKYSNELNMAPNDKPIHSIDLMADGNCLIIDIPCEYAWNDDAKRKSSSKVRDSRQCGIQFGKLTPKQIFLLRNIINCCTSPEPKA